MIPNNTLILLNDIIFYISQIHQGFKHTNNNNIFLNEKTTTKKQSIGFFKKISAFNDTNQPINKKRTQLECFKLLYVQIKTISSQIY